MEQRTAGARPAALGLLGGIVLGGGAATLVFGVTGDAMAFLLVGICAVAGLLVGAGVESVRAKRRVE